MGKKGLIWSFLEFSQKFSYYFLLEVTKNGRRYNSVSLCKPHIWKNSALQLKGQNALMQSDCKVFRSLIFLEGVHRYSSIDAVDFLHGDIH